MVDHTITIAISFASLKIRYKKFTILILSNYYTVIIVGLHWERIVYYTIIEV